MSAEFKTSDYEYGLTKIMGQTIKEVHGYVSGELGDPAFKITGIELEDGTMLQCEGEHDMPYIAYNDKLDDAVALIAEEEEQEQQNVFGKDEEEEE